MRKLLSLLLVAAMVLGLASTAFAFSDVTATAQVGPAEKLAALGILKGYEDGTFKPENPITRAEFAAVIVRAMGLESAAKLINNPTKFPDVTANYAWAYGYINIASSKGIIKGDPDGKFRPGDKVSYAEAITMLLRAAGWDAACSQMDWPAGFVMKAVEFGLTTDVNFDANSPANRGEVAVMTYNTLTKAYMAKWNDTTKVYENDSVKFMAKYLNAEEKTIVFEQTSNINSGLTADKVITADGTMTVPAGVDANALLGHEVRVIKVGTDKYVYAKDAQDTAKVVTGTNDANYLAVDKHLHVTVGTTSSQYDLATDTSGNVTTIVVRNNVKVSGAPADNAVAANDSVTLFLDTNGKVRYIIAKAYDASEVLVTAKTVKGVDGATANTFTAGGVTYDVASNTVFTLNGQTASFADLAVGQVVYVQKVGTVAYTVDMFNGTVTGKVTAVSLNSDGKGVLTINGTNYVISDAAFTNNDVTLDGAVKTLTQIGDLVNYDATLKLNKDGKARVVTGATTAIIGKVVSVDDANDKLVVAVKGVNTEFTHLSTVEAAADGLAPNEYVSMTQRADGKITNITEFSLSSAYTVKAIDATARKITLDNGSGVLSIVDYSANAYGVRLGTWGDISLLKVGDTVVYYKPSTAILYFEVNPSFAGHVYGKVIGTTSVEGKTYVYVNVKGEVKSYECTDATPAAAGTLADLTLDSLGVATAVDAVIYENDGGTPATDYTFTVDTIAGTSYTVTRSDSTIQIHDLSSAIVYKADGTLGSLSDLTAGKVYKRVMNGSTVAVVVIQP